MSGSDRVDQQRVKGFVIRQSESLSKQYFPSAWLRVRIPFERRPFSGAVVFALAKRRGGSTAGEGIRTLDLLLGKEAL